MSSDTQTVAPTPAAPAPPATTQASLAARLGAEAFGTFGLVLAIVGVALYDSYSNAGLTLAVALAGGLVVAALIVGLGHVSGGHFNPAVTLGVTVAGRARWADLVPYWVAQIVGGVVAAGALFITIPQNFAKLAGQGQTTHEYFAGTANGFGTHSPLYSAIDRLAVQNQVSLSDYEAHFGVTTHGPTMLQAILIEAIVTALFVGIVIAVTDKRTNAMLAPIAIGLGLFASILIAAPFTNASVNPARSTASAVFAAKSLGDIFTGHGVAGQLWVFWVGPLLGALVAALFYLAFAAARPQLSADDAVADALENGADVVIVEEVVVTEVDAVVIAEPAAEEPATDPAPAEQVADAEPVAAVDDTAAVSADQAEGAAGEADTAEDTQGTDEKPEGDSAR